eukprot:14020235-Alexandrium_andersonii.AAC.1
MADLADVQGVLSQSPSALASVVGEAGPPRKRTKLRVGDLTPAKCINPIGGAPLGWEWGWLRFAGCRTSR